MSEYKYPGYGVTKEHLLTPRPEYKGWLPRRK